MKEMSRYDIVDGIPREIKASVYTITKRREPLIDKMIQLLNDQTCLSFEYILVDGYYFQRKDLMLKMIEDLEPQFPVRYVPDKPTRWRGQRPALSSARNTAIIWARGERIIGVDDCCSDMCSDLVERHLYWGQKGYAVSGSWRDKYGWESRHKVTPKAKVVDPGWFYGAVNSFNLEDVLKINGYEELLDGEQGQEDCDLGIRFSRAGVEMLYDPDLWVEFDRSTHTLTQVETEKLEKKDWGKETRIMEPKKRVLSDGKEHFANEWLTQQLLKDKDRTQPLGNHFNLRELRKIMTQYDYDVLKVQEALAQYIDPEPLDWRDNQPISEIVGRVQTDEDG